MAADADYLATPPPLVGRADALRRLVALAAERPGALVVTGPPAAGATRVAREAAARLALDGAVVVVAEGPGPAEERLAAALAEAGHDPDPVRAGRLRALVVLLGDHPGDPGLPGRLAARLAGTRALAVLTAREPPGDAAALVLRPLPEEDARALARAAAPEIAPAGIDWATGLGDGLPGRIVPLARAARAWEGGDAPPPPVPVHLARPVLELAERLDPVPRDVARWAAVAGGTVDAAGLARVCGLRATAVQRALDALVAAGMMEEVPGPGRPRHRFADRLAPAVLEAALPAGERRARHAAALVAGRAAGDDPRALARHAVAAADPAAVVAHSTRAAEAERAAGEHRAALAHADRALAWWSEEMDGRRRLDALHERGMALLDLSAWADAAAALEGAAAGRRALGLHDEALASAAAAGAARWNLGQHDAALRALREHARAGGEAGAAPSEARADALAQAAGMAVMTSRFAEAMDLAGEARAVAAAAGADETATRALIFMGMAESGRGGAGGLLHLARARAEGARAAGAGQRNESLGAIYESHVLLALGRPAEAAERARAGIARARELDLVDHELVLTGNLGEALAALGELTSARSELERAAAGWEGLGRVAPSPADPGMAWLVLAEGRLEEAFERYRALAAVATPDAALFEQIAPVATGHALAAAAAGREEEAARIVRAALSAWSGTDDRLNAVPLLAAAADAGDPLDAEHALAALADMAATGSEVAAAFHAYAQGRRRARAGRDGDPGLREASARFADLGLRWWSARSLFEAGAGGLRDEAAAQALLDARRAFRDMGAGGWRRRAEARLRAMGRRIPTRVRRPGAPPRAGLSPRELEVLEHLAEGLRNRDIGERLFISDRTVARHLAQIFAKLGVSTRTAAVREGRARGLLTGDRA